MINNYSNSEAVGRQTSMEEKVEPVVQRSKRGRQTRNPMPSSGISDEGIEIKTEVVLQTENKEIHGQSEELNGGQKRAPGQVACPAKPELTSGNRMSMESGYRSTIKGHTSGKDVDGGGNSKGLGEITKSDSFELNAIGMPSGQSKHVLDTGQKKRTVVDRSRNESCGRDNPALTIHEEDNS